MDDESDGVERQVESPPKPVEEDILLSQQEIHGRRTIMKPKIKKLPDHVIGQLQSSAAINDLGDVVSRLVENSLDAEASAIEVDVNFPRGGCIVEDNGVGIPSIEMAEGGALGRMYYTSKFGQPEDAVHGHHGTFIAGLSAVCLLTITSRERGMRSTDSLICHRSDFTSRLNPAPASHALTHRSGTRVTVRDLFGNLPVRVKQRALLPEAKAEQLREINAIKTSLVNLLLAWRRPVTVRIRNGDHSITLGTSNTRDTGPDHDTLVGGARSRMSPAAIQSLLLQAGLISPLAASSWIPASASSGDISVKGAISIHPVPSKSVQFISFGVHPVKNSHRHNEIFEYINRVFNESSFGVCEETNIDESEVERRKVDRRFKQDGFTKKRMLQGRKGVDRWPMFYLDIAINSSAPIYQHDVWKERTISNLQPVFDVLDALLHSWLRAHDFKVYRRKRQRTVGTNLDDPHGSALQNVTLGKELQPDDTRTSVHQSDHCSTANVIKQKLTVMPRSKGRKPNTPRQSTAFGEWTRVKTGSGAADGLPHHVSEQKPSSIASSAQDCATVTGSSISIEQALFAAEANIQSVASETTRAATTQVILSTAEWIDPITGRTHIVNARTGQAIQMAPQTPAGASGGTYARQATPSNVPRLTFSRGSLAEVDKGGRQEWLARNLEEWSDPVFKPSELPIRHSVSRYLSDDLQYIFCGNQGIGKASDTDNPDLSRKLTKSGLKQARIISQVDSKFILVAMPCVLASNEGTDGEVLVLIDQHAADERCRLEDLFEQLCRPSLSISTFRDDLGTQSRVESVDLAPPIIYQLDANEAAVFQQYEGHFAGWGFLYDVHQPDTTSYRPANCRLTVRGLSPTIAGRCQTDPKLLISMLRTEAWKLNSGRQYGHRPAAVENDNQPQHAWLCYISGCPQGLVEMLHSRACRSAIMFNDQLSLTECQQLVTKLGDCAFPFHCAHGRPSMVPLVSMHHDIYTALEDIKPGKAGEDITMPTQNGTFVDAFKAWNEFPGQN